MEGRRTKQTKREIRDPRLDNTHSHEEEEETDRGQRERGALHMHTNLPLRLHRPP